MPLVYEARSTTVLCMAGSSPATPAFVMLDRYGFLAVEGARAVEFLQGQLTCDLRGASALSAVEGAWCTPKGRVVCSLAAWPANGERVILRMAADLLASTAERLARYAALSRVRVEPVAMRCVGLLDVTTAALRARLSLPPPGDVGGIGGIEGGALFQSDTAGARAELWLTADAADAWRQRLSAALREGTGNDWSVALVRNAVAEVQAATQDLFLPQMLGYDTNGRVSFRKGCYPGQEIVARTHYKGGVKRHLQHLQGEGAPPAPGTTLNLNGQSAGTVVASASVGDGRCELLAVLADDPASSVFRSGETEFHLLP